MQTREDGTHLLTRKNDGAFGCSCRGGSIRIGHSPLTCTHIERWVKELGVTTTVKKGIVMGPPLAEGDEGFSAVDEGLSLPPVTPDDNIIESGGTIDPAEVMAMTGLTMDLAMKASAISDTRWKHILDKDGYIIPEKFDVAFEIGWILEEKLDGHRCIIRKRGDVVTTSLRSIPTLPDHIIDEIRQIPMDVDLDGELRVNLPGSVSTDVPAKKYRKDLVFIAFDVLTLADCNVCSEPLENRREILRLTIGHIVDAAAVFMVAQSPVTWAKVLEIWANDGEGAILKRNGSRYALGDRNGDWLKVKALEHHVVTLTGYEAGVEGPHSVYLFEFEDKVCGQCRNPTIASREASANRNEIGMQFVVECQQRVRGGKPRHPRFDHWAGSGEVKL